MPGNFESCSEVRSLESRSGSGESNRSGREVEEGKSKHFQGDRRKEVRLTYSDSRPATPRTLPKLPVNKGLVLDGNVQDINRTLGSGGGGAAANILQANTDTIENSLGAGKDHADHGATSTIDDTIKDGFKCNYDLNLPLSTSFTGDKDVRKRVPGEELEKEGALEHFSQIGGGDRRPG